MRTFKSSDLTHKRAEVMSEAEKNGVIIQELKTNGDVRREFIVIERCVYKEIMTTVDELSNG